MLALMMLLVGCAAKPQVIIDKTVINDQQKYQRDFDECKNVAAQYDLTEETAGSSIIGASVGGATVAGIATAVAGAVFAPAIPFIVAGAAAGGTLGGGTSQSTEYRARERIMNECLQRRGYSVYVVN